MLFMLFCILSHALYPIIPARVFETPYQYAPYSEKHPIRAYPVPHLSYTKSKDTSSAKHIVKNIALISSLLRTDHRTITYERCDLNKGYSWCETKRRCIRKEKELCSLKLQPYRLYSHDCDLTRDLSWCAKKKKCIRLSEEPCIIDNTNIIIFDDEQNPCDASAGYSWCETKNKCINVREESCIIQIGSGKAPGICNNEEGYWWCKSKQKCIRSWEELCPRNENREIDPSDCVKFGHVWCKAQNKCIHPEIDTCLEKKKNSYNCDQKPGYFWCELKMKCMSEDSCLEKDSKGIESIQHSYNFKKSYSKQKSSLSHKSTNEFKISDEKYDPPRHGRIQNFYDHKNTTDDQTLNSTKPDIDKLNSNNFENITGEKVSTNCTKHEGYRWCEAKGKCIQNLKEPCEENIENEQNSHLCTETSGYSWCKEKGRCIQISKEMCIAEIEKNHNCIGSAGYVWCKPKNKCVRKWEEKCDNNIIQDIYLMMNNLNSCFEEDYSWCAPKKRCIKSSELCLENRHNPQNPHRCKQELGYLWCKAKRKCILSWEESCVLSIRARDTKDM